MNTIQNEKGTVTTIRAERSGAWAEIKLECFWSGDGKTFTVTTNSYRALNNGRSKGNIKLGLVSKDNTGWKELTGSGVQDGKWHDFIQSLSVAGDAKSADIHFNWIYDQKFPDGDISMTGMNTVSFSAAMSMPPGDVSE